MKNRTLLVDSSFLLKRSYFGNKDTYTSSFGHIGGLYSFFTTIRKLVKQHSINRVVLAWDGENGGIQRHNIDLAYKANRKDKSWNEKIVLSDAEIRREKEKDESVLKQRKRIQAYAEELFFRQIEVQDIEADDIIAKYCETYHNSEDIYIFTNDRDFAQLLDLNITILFDNIDTPITKDNFLFNFKYHYSNALVMKIICGDTSDNIKGIEGIQETTLLNLFPELKYKHLMVKDICGKADVINQERVSNKKKPLKSLENLLNNIDRLIKNYKLINLKKPFLNEQANDELEQLDMPLSDEDRGSKNLYKMIIEDEFLTVYGGTFPSYVEPFYPIIMNEKRILKEYQQKVNL
jgi:5'-3' exonuclease